MKLRPVGLSRRGFLAGLASAIAAVAIPISDSFAAPLFRGARSGGGGGGDITPSLVVEYVDTSGVRQTTTVVNGVTSISGVYPFCVWFDATGTRSVVATTQEGAWGDPGGPEIGYLIDYGEGLGGTWAYGGQSKDQDVGPPTFPRVFTTAGTFTVRLRCKDTSGNEATISMTVVVSAPPSATHIPVSNGAWPTWASGTHYTLDRGGDYTSFGTINTQGLHNILISATGSGADPIVATFNPDNRGRQSSPITRAKNIRTLNIDVNSFDTNFVGYDYCGVIGGRVRHFDANSSTGYDVEYNACTTSTQRDSVRKPRGVFVWNTSELNCRTNGNQYVAIYQMNRVAFVGNVVNKNGNADNHGFRCGGWHNVFRHNNFYASVATVNMFKLQALGLTAHGGDPDLWGATDGSGVFLYKNEFYAIEHNQFGRSGETQPEAAISIAPENVSNPNQTNSYCAAENNVGFGSNWQSANPNVIDLGGEFLTQRGNRMSLGTGAYATASTGKNSPTNDGPYGSESANTRPAPTPF